MPRWASCMRGTVLPPWPKTIIALMLSRWSTSSASSSVASNHRVEGMPGTVMFCTGSRASRPPFAGTASKRLTK